MFLNENPLIESPGKPELQTVSLTPGPAQEVKRAIFTSMKDVWAQLPETSDSTLAVEEDRDGG
ncbi:MAG: hypothetical protein NTZ56_09480 [Acidobacteria bacterium]|nr:hypothetical protein [Acidobacteriota bacterium]